VVVLFTQMQERKSLSSRNRQRESFHRWHDEKCSQKEPWGYANMALALGAPEQGKTWEWLQ